MCGALRFECQVVELLQDMKITPRLPGAQRVVENARSCSHLSHRLCPGLCSSSRLSSSDAPRMRDATAENLRVHSHDGPKRLKRYDSITLRVGPDEAWNLGFRV